MAFSSATGSEVFSAASVAVDRAVKGGRSSLAAGAGPGICPDVLGAAGRGSETCGNCRACWFVRFREPAAQPAVQTGQTMVSTALYLSQLLSSCCHG